MARRTLAALTVVVGCAWAAVGLSQPPKADDKAQPKARKPINVWRTRLVSGDADRNWTYVWSIDGVPGALRLVAADGTSHETEFVHLGWTPDWWEQDLHKGLRLKGDMPAGKYRLHAQNGDLGIELEVVAPAAARPVQRLKPGASVADFEKAIDAGDVVLEPGEYIFPRRARLTADRTIRGYGAVIRRVPDGDYRETMFTPADRVAIYGVVFDGPYYVFHSFQPPLGRDMVIKYCTFRSGVLGEWPRDGLLMQNCDFEHASSALDTGSSVYYRCTFRGLANSHAFDTWGGQRTVVADCRWDGTDRGLVLQTFRGPVANNLYVGLDFRNINKVTNGSECVLAEGKQHEVRDNLFIHLRYSGCVGSAVQFWETPAFGNYFLDGYSDGGGGIILAGVDGARQSDNVFRDWEVRGAGVYLGAAATFNTFERCAFVDWRPTRSNQHNSGSARYKLQGRAVIEADGRESRSNRFSDCSVIGQPPGVFEHRGIRRD